MSFLNKFIFEFNIDEVILLNLFFNCDYNAFVKENPLNIIYIVFSLFIYAFITETKNIYLFEVFNQKFSSIIFLNPQLNKKRIFFLW